jgi:hypothetical protein
MGLFDELACFNRALSAKEIRRIHTHQATLAKLLK